MLLETAHGATPKRTVRVAFCSASVGCGHTRAAVAVHDAIQQLGCLRRGEFVEALEHAPHWFAVAYRDGYLTAIRRMPRLVGSIYSRTDGPLRSGRGLRALLHPVEDWMHRTLRARRELHDADAIVSTHFLTTAILGRMRQRGELQAPLITVVTDEHPHAVWLHRGCDMTCVASDAARSAAIAAGLQPSRVTVTGIPIDPRFALLAESSARAVDTTTMSRILVCGGGHGLGEISEAVESLVCAQLSARITVVCGRNEQLRARLEELRSLHPECMIDVVGYSSQMHDLMAQADFMVGKPGGLTSTEARAMGLPMLLLRPIPGQEEHNARKLVAVGAALQLATAQDAGAVARELLSDVGRLRDMRASTAAAGRPRAAFDVARCVLATAW